MFDRYACGIHNLTPNHPTLVGVCEIRKGLLPGFAYVKLVQPNEITDLPEWFVLPLTMITIYYS